MKFEEWYESYHNSKSEDTDEGNYQFKAWQACKNEVLKILQSNTIEHNGPHGTGYETLNTDCINEIRKL